MHWIPSTDSLSVDAFQGNIYLPLGHGQGAVIIPDWKDAMQWPDILGSSRGSTVQILLGSAVPKDVIL